MSDTHSHANVAKPLESYQLKKKKTYVVDSLKIVFVVGVTSFKYCSTTGFGRFFRFLIGRRGGGVDT